MVDGASLGRSSWRACLVIISIVPLFMFVGKNFLPVDDQSQFEVNVRAPEGSTLPSTSTLGRTNRGGSCASCRA